MENVAPTLLCAVYLHRFIENGDSMAVALRKYLNQFNDACAVEVAQVLLCYEQGRQYSIPTMSPQREALFLIIQNALNGYPVSPALNHLTEELYTSSYAEMEQYAVILTHRVLVPVLLLQFPALLLLILGPLIQSFLEAL